MEDGYALDAGQARDGRHLETLLSCPGEDDNLLGPEQDAWLVGDQITELGVRASLAHLTLQFQ